MLIHGGWIIAALLQLAPTALGQGCPMGHSVMRAAFNCALSNMEVTNYTRLLGP